MAGLTKDTHTSKLSSMQSRDPGGVPLMGRPQSPYNIPTLLHITIITRCKDMHGYKCVSDCTRCKVEHMQYVCKVVSVELHLASPMAQPGFFHTLVSPS